MSSNSAGTHRQLQAIWTAGLLLRLVTFWLQQPTNNDVHLEIFELIAALGRPPVADAATQAFNPPLYYLLGLPLYATGSIKALQALSLACSLLNFSLIYRFVARSSTISAENKALALLLAAFLPNFVRFNNTIGPDSLGNLLGTLLLMSACAAIEAPRRALAYWMAIFLGLGLLTKGTFLAFVIPVAAVLVYLAKSRALRTKDATIALGLAVVLGGYKFIENTIVFGHPIVHGLDFPWDWVPEQIVDYRLWRAIAFDPIHMVRFPFFNEGILDSIPMLMYSTFWFPYLMESNFTAAADFNWLFFPRAIYLLALPVTGVIVAGFFSTWCPSVGSAPFERRIALRFLAACLLCNLIVVVGAGLKYEVWSCFQGRLLFPSATAIVVLVDQGFRTLTWPASALIVRLTLIALSGMFVVFQLVEAAMAAFFYL
jgi:hypothetical protein